MFGKACRLLVELQHRVMWAIKKFNFDMAVVGSNRKLQLNESKSLRNNTYVSAKIYKERTKAFHNKHIHHKSFEPHQKSLAFQFEVASLPR